MRDSLTALKLISSEGTFNFHSCSLSHHWPRRYMSLECDEVFRVGLGIAENNIHGGFVDIICGRVIDCLASTVFGQNPHYVMSFGCAAGQHLALIHVRVA